MINNHQLTSSLSANNLDEVEFHEITTNISIVGTIIFGDDAC
ncbi:unnamed protein product, partial [Rotaria sp. Silwood2]